MRRPLHSIGGIIRSYGQKRTRVNKVKMLFWFSFVCRQIRSVQGRRTPGRFRRETRRKSGAARAVHGHGKLGASGHRTRRRFRLIRAALKKWNAWVQSTRRYTPHNACMQWPLAVGRYVRRCTICACWPERKGDQGRG
jgi:hypothetical protein